MAQVHSSRVQLLLANSDLNAARLYIENHEISLGSQVLPHQLVDYLTEIRVLFAEKNLEQALENAKQVTGISEHTGSVTITLELKLIQASISYQRGDVERALSYFTSALELASPEMIVRPFIHAESPFSDLVSKIGKDPSHRSKFLSRLELELSPTKVLRTDSGLVEKLSPRELEVLRHLVGGLSNDELAKVLFVSLSTIKTHLLHIYAKLDVKNRTSAIDRARQLGLV